LPLRRDIRSNCVRRLNATTDRLSPIDGTAVYQLTVNDLPIEGFWSISVYNTEDSLRVPYANREAYEQACRERRISHLRERIIEFTPKAVVFYSLKSREDWHAIAGVELSQVSDGIHTGRNNSTLFVVTRHPATTGVTNDYFHQVGRLIAKAGEH
jgi:hypothetical protein